MQKGGYTGPPLREFLILNFLIFHYLFDDWLRSCSEDIWCHASGAIYCSNLADPETLPKTLKQPVPASSDLIIKPATLLLFVNFPFTVSEMLGFMGNTTVLLIVRLL
jgi:hypothetical protein